MKRLLFLIIFLTPPLWSAQPPYESDNTEDQGNFEQIYNEMATHHLSSRDVIPDQDSTRNLGGTNREWKGLYVDSVTVTNLNSLFGYKVGTFTSDGGGGQVVTGVGFKPRLVIFWHQRGSDTGTGFSIGTMDSLGGQWSSSANIQESGPDASGTAIQTDRCIHIVTTNGATYLSAHYASMGSDGFGIVWDTASAGQVIGYIAFQ